MWRLRAYVIRLLAGSTPVALNIAIRGELSMARPGVVGGCYFS